MIKQSIAITIERDSLGFTPREIGAVLNAMDVAKAAIAFEVSGAKVTRGGFYSMKDPTPPEPPKPKSGWKEGDILQCKYSPTYYYKLLKFKEYISDVEVWEYFSLTLLQKFSDGRFPVNRFTKIST